MSEMDLELRAVNVLVELDRIGWAYQEAGDDEYKCKCPSPTHKDQSPSCSVNISKKLFKCQASGCGVSGDFITFLALALGVNRATILQDVVARYGVLQDKTIDAETIERYHTAIWGQRSMLSELYKRGMTDDLIRKYRLGFDGGRITIPITNASGHYVNVRKYLPGAPGAEKMKNARGHGDIRLFPLDQLKFDSIIVTGGEVKAIVTAARMNDFGVGCVTATCGEGNWEARFSEQLRGKQVWVCMDVDAEGQGGAQSVCAMVYGYARWVGSLLLPLDVDKYPKGDLNDYWGPEAHLPEQLIELLEGVPAWEPKIAGREKLNGDIFMLHLAEAKIGRAHV